jgi:DNA-binding response OmpR family regulator
VPEDDPVNTSQSAEAPRVLVVDDEAPLARVVASYLEREGFAVDLAHDGPTAVTAAREHLPALVVLDVMLPGFDGLEVCRQIRTFSDCYVIMLTARDEEIDKVLGLTVGADDYLVKPFSPRELVARVRAMLRRPRTLGPPVSPSPEPTAAPAAAVLEVGDVRVDLEARVAWAAGAEVELTRTEFDLLAALVSEPRRAFSRRQLIDSVWGPDWYGDEHIVDVHVGHLRRKLGDDATNPQHIRTVRGVGYGMAR